MCRISRAVTNDTVFQKSDDILIFQITLKNEPQTYDPEGFSNFRDTIINRSYL